MIIAKIIFLLAATQNDSYPGPRHYNRTSIQNAIIGQTLFQFSGNTLRKTTNKRFEIQGKDCV